jgi:hypothetical protein
LAAEVATAPIARVFEPTGWKTAALDHITFQMPDYQKEAAFYIALMGWQLRSDDGTPARSVTSPGVRLEAHITRKVEVLPRHALSGLTPMVTASPRGDVGSNRR